MFSRANLWLLMSLDCGIYVTHMSHSVCCRFCLQACQSSHKPHDRPGGMTEVCQTNDQEVVGLTPNPGVHGIR